MASEKAQSIIKKDEFSDELVEQVYEIDPIEEKQVVRKLDRVILPLMALVYFMQHLDKQSINYASVFGLQDDTHLKGQQFSWAVSLFYFGQLLSEYPAAYLMSRLPITRFVGVTIVLWGIVEMCLATSNSFQSLGAIRFLLGFFEGAVSPSFIIITSNWYRHSEHPVRVATWVSMHGMASIFGALIMYGIGSTDTHLASWRALFLICGGLTIAVGLIFIFVMPRDTKTAWFLNERERAVATQRLALDRATRDKSDFNMGQFKEALLSPRTWLFFFMAMFITFPTPIVKFSSLVIKGFGYSSFQTMLVGLPAGAFQIATVWFSAMMPFIMKNKRCFTGCAIVLVPMTGSLVLLTLPAQYKWGIVVSTWLASCTSGPLSVVVQLMASNIKGNTKKSVVSSLFFIGYCIGCICGPQLWQSQDAPRYYKGCIASVTSFVLLILSFIFMYFNLKRVNTKRDREAAERGGLPDEHVGIAEESDLTDKQDRGFRFTT